MTMNKAHLYFIQCAVEEAQKSNMRQKHGCVIVKRKKVIAKGHNDHSGYDKYGSELTNKRRTIHAEADAIRNCISNGISMKGAVMYVVRFNIRTNEATYSKPCHNCFELILSCVKKHGLRKIYYTKTDHN